MPHKGPDIRQITPEQINMLRPYLDAFWNGTLPLQGGSVPQIDFTALLSVAESVFTLIGHPKTNYRTAFTNILHRGRQERGGSVEVDIRLFNTLSDFFQDAADILNLHRKAYQEHHKTAEQKETALMNHLDMISTAPHFEHIADAVDVLEQAASIFQGARLRSHIKDILDMEPAELAKHPVPRRSPELGTHPWLEDKKQKATAHQPLKKHTLILSRKNAKRIAEFFDENGLTRAMDTALPCLEERGKEGDLRALHIAVDKLHQSDYGLVFLFEDDLRALSQAKNIFQEAALALAMPPSQAESASDARTCAKEKLTTGAKTLKSNDYKKDILQDIIEALAKEHGVDIPSGRQR